MGRGGRKSSEPTPRSTSHSIFTFAVAYILACSLFLDGPDLAHKQVELSDGIVI